MASLHELALRIQHDLGKYATLQARWLPPDAEDAERLEAARADLLRTRSGPDGVADVIEVAEPLRRELLPFTSDPVVTQLLGVLADLDGIVPLLEQADVSPASVERALSAASELRAASRALVEHTRP